MSKMNMRGCVIYSFYLLNNNVKTTIPKEMIDTAIPNATANIKTKPLNSCQVKVENPHTH